MNPLLKHYHLGHSVTRDPPCIYALSNRCDKANLFSRYKLDKTVITSDLTRDRPQWILSAYGPGRDPPLQLFGGHPREQSFEELRLRHYELATQGNQQQAIQEAQALVKSAEQQIQTVLNDVDGAINYIANGENEHPNRLDICKAKGATSTQPLTSAPNQQATSTFGQPSSSAPTFGQPSAASAFGRPSVSPFGQPPAPTSTFGQPSAPTFGQPSQPSAFGQPSALGRPTTSFGQPSSTFRRPSISAPTFGQPSAPNSLGVSQQQPNTFGKPSRLGLPQQPSTAINPFGQPSAPTPPATFGKPSAPSQPSEFGRPSTLNPSPVFGQPATSGATSGFSQTSTPPPNPFGQPTVPPTTSSFGQPSTAAPNPFGQRTSTANQPFSSNKTSGPPNTLQPPNGPVANRTNVRSISGQGTNGAQVQKDSQGKITTWKGIPVRYFDEEPCYKGNDGDWQRIWFPDGPPVFAKTVDLPNEAYDEGTKANYRHLKETGTFQDGIMPALPPKREWCSWNF